MLKISYAYGAQRAPGANLSKFGKILKSGFGKKMKRKNQVFFAKKISTERTSIKLEKKCASTKKKGKEAFSYELVICSQ